MKNKSDAFENFKIYLNEIENQFGRKKKELEVIEAVDMNQMSLIILLDHWE